MKKLIVAAAIVSGFAVPAFASGQGLNPNSKSQGSNVGQASSASTGNGAAIRQEGRTGTRDDIVQGLQASESRGRMNSNNNSNRR